MAHRDAIGPEADQIRPQRPRHVWIRLGSLAALLVGLVLLALWLGVDRIDAATVRSRIDQAGAFGVVLFIAVFPIAVLLHIPGMALVIGGSLAFGERVGFCASFVGGLMAVSVAFAVARLVGGQALQEIERPFVRRALQTIDRKPIRTVMMLRSVFWFAPPLSFALALSSMRFRDYFAGCVLGLVPPIAVGTILAKLIVRVLS